MNYWHSQESDIEWLHSLKRQAKELEGFVLTLVIVALIVIAGLVAPVGR